MLHVHSEWIYAGSKIEAQAIVTIETSSAFPRSQGDFQKDCFFKDGLAKYDVNVR